MRVITLLAIFATVHSALCLDGPCGGLLEANAGEFEFTAEEILERGNICVWIVKLTSRQTVRFNLTQLEEGLTVSLYEEHNPSQSIKPTRLNSSNVGISVENEGQTLVVVLSQTGSGQRFAFAWDSLASRDPDLVTSANYINQKSGHVLWKQFDNRERLTLSLNVDQSQSLDVEANSEFGDCSRVNDCQCSYVALYEIASDGFLREVSVACDRPSKIEVRNLFPNVLAFVYLNSSLSVNDRDFVRIKWTISNSDVSSTTTLETSTTSTEPTTTPAPIIIFNECGGTVNVGYGETLIEYLPPGGYRTMEFCVWTLVPTAPYSGLTIDYVPFSMSNGAGVMITNWNEDALVTTTRIVPNNYNTTISLRKPYATINFSSYEIRGGGFQVTIKGTGNLEGDFNYRGFWQNQTQGNFSYPEDFGLENYKPNERVAIVYQTPSYSMFDLTVDYTDLEDDFIILYKYVAWIVGTNAILIGSTNGSNPEGVPSLASSWNGPRLILFHSNHNSIAGKGFSMSWRRSP